MGQGPHSRPGLTLRQTVDSSQPPWLSWHSSKSRHEKRLNMLPTFLGLSQLGSEPAEQVHHVRSGKCGKELVPTEDAMLVTALIRTLHAMLTPLHAFRASLDGEGEGRKDAGEGGGVRFTARKSAAFPTHFD